MTLHIDDSNVCRLTALAFFLCTATAHVAAQTVGLIEYDDRVQEGFTLFSPFPSDTTYLINNEGRVVHTWAGNNPAMHAYLLEDGSILRGWDPFGSDSLETFAAGGDAGIVDRIDWDGNLTWRFTYSNEQHRLHHDIEPMPNGNVLMIAWELKTLEEISAAGGDTSRLDEDVLWPDHIIEVQPTGPESGEIVWEWHMWDHLIQDFDPTKANFGVVENHPELIDINRLHSGHPDWAHLNGVDYNPDLDQIVLSSPMFNEMWIIDHSTTSDEAAGHSGGDSGMGGDLLYRWGNPIEYRAGTNEDQTLFFQHDARWIKPGRPGEGNILYFNNRVPGPGDDRHSTVGEITTPILADGTYMLEQDGSYGPESPDWRYAADPPTDFFGVAVSGAQRQPNGNTLICNGVIGDLFEVTPEGETVWHYVNPWSNREGIQVQGDTLQPLRNLYFKCDRYLPNHPAFQDRDLRGGRVIQRRAAVQPRLIAPRHEAFEVDLIPMLLWSSVDGAESYRLEISESFSFNDPLLALGGTKDTTFVAGPLRENTRYYWRVLASNADGLWSDVGAFTTGLAAPARTTLSRPVDNAEGVSPFATLEWSEHEDVTFYQLQIDTDPLFRAPIVDDSTLTVAVFQPEVPLDYGTTYYWRVRGLRVEDDHRAAGEWSFPYSFTVAVGTQTTNEDIPSEFALYANYPNPFSERTTVTFDLPAPTDVTIRIYDVLGHVVKTVAGGVRQAGQHEIILSASDLSSGPYFYRLYTNTGSAQGRMVVVR